MKDEPITWPSSVSLHFVSKLAAEQVKVVLTGEGSDELFGGYERYRWTILNRRLSDGYSILAVRAPQPDKKAACRIVVAKGGHSAGSSGTLF